MPHLCESDHRELNRLHASFRRDGRVQDTPLRIIPQHPCYYCQKPCALNYVFCYRCASQLPTGLRTGVTRTYDPCAQVNRAHKLACDAAWAYLNAPDKDAYTWEKARECVGWAMDALEEHGELTNDEIVEMILESGRKRDLAQGVKHRNGTI